MKRPLCCAIFIAVAAVSCAQSDNLAVLNQFEGFSCPAPGTRKFEEWGRSGAALTCEIRHGSFVTAENGKLALSGQYEDGRKVGVWRWYDDQGNVVKELDYADLQIQP